ncbi:hypothetical protein, conserved [Babesia bigemina]|uniref:Uncharacterized protein n=1 Tax=Babesia bigemina TaxID=5866 RepID=A0A061DEG5_BABBI|nr:hypothetical protein, conserved [Babesia bigemina]CDR97240.1 hypothetical protein, conserved [Babesia bigemina]|eukprot:XP_012769426.1 hypothetical protein, conserved [Babesia bigemina]
MVAVKSSDDLPSAVEDDADYEVAKNQIVTEVKEVESLFKAVLSRIFSHLYHYVKHKAMQSYLSFYIVSPLGLGIGNLLNSNLNDQYITNKLGLPENATPATFNIAYEQVEVPSHFSKAHKQCWLIRSTNPKATKAFVLLHGWFGNMQSCLQFADMLSKMGSLDTHHILILDLHDDSGKSFETNVGLKGVADIYDAAAYLNRELGVDHMSLYAQSVSCISALLFNELVSRIKKPLEDTTREAICPLFDGMDPAVLRNFTVDTIIMESPVANIRNHVANSTTESVNWFMEHVLSLVNKGGFHIDNLSLRTLLRDPETCSKSYIMQGAKDTVTTPQMLRSELMRSDLPSRINMFLFQDGGHANLSATSKPDYYYTIKHVTVGRNAWEFLTRKGTKTRVDDPDGLVM